MQTHNPSDADPSRQAASEPLSTNVPVPQPIFDADVPDGMRIYVSSTSVDLLDHRRAVIEMLRKRGYSYLAQEEYVAEDRLPLEKCLADVDECNRSTRCCLSA